MQLTLRDGEDGKAELGSRFTISMGRGLETRDKGDCEDGSGVKRKDMRQGVKRRRASLRKVSLMLPSPEEAHAQRKRSYNKTQYMAYTCMSAWIYTHVCVTLVNIGKYLQISLS